MTQSEIKSAVKKAMNEGGYTDRSENGISINDFVERVLVNLFVGKKK